MRRAVCTSSLQSDVKASDSGPAVRWSYGAADGDPLAFGAEFYRGPKQQIPAAPAFHPSLSCSRVKSVL